MPVSLQGFSAKKSIGGERIYTNLLQEEGNGFRLPTTMEWELAPAFKEKMILMGPLSIPRVMDITGRASGDFLNEEATKAVSWYNENSEGRSQEVGSKEPNYLGLYDMSGNGWEWCFDWHPQYVRHSRVIRGGGWNNRVEHMQIGLLSSASPGILLHGGFRLVQSR